MLSHMFLVCVACSYNQEDSGSDGKMVWSTVPCLCDSDEGTVEACICCLLLACAIDMIAEVQMGVRCLCDGNKERVLV